MKEKDKVLQALCDGLGENYKLMEIDLELCIYRNFGNRFEVEVSGVHTAKQNKKATIYLWCMDATGAHGYVIKKVGEVPRNKIGKTVEELYEYSENLISQGYDCYEKVQAYLKELVKKGTAVILISSDLNELLKLSNRILILRNGVITKEVLGGSVNEEQILAYASGLGK